MAGLYIHIPFCHSKCVYCDFYSSPRRNNMEAVAKGIIDEFNQRRLEIDEPFTTIYIGGGTPSILTSQTLSAILKSLPIDDAFEITIEANPEDVSENNVALWRSLGINRVSMGIQSLNDATLHFLGRRHTAENSLDAVKMLKNGGFDNISVDLIYGIPGLGEKEWEESLTLLMKQPITHLSAYCLTYHEGTYLFKIWKQGKITPSTDEQIERQFNILQDVARREGFEHYEISNLAKPGFRSAHNSSYWEPSSKWLGIGPSAHSFDGKVRRVDISDTARWLERLPTPFEIEYETDTDLVNDNIVTSLRTLEGLDLDTVPEKYRASLIKDAEPFIKSGDMELKANRLSIIPSKWLISDSYLRKLIRD